MAMTGKSTEGTAYREWADGASPQARTSWKKTPELREERSGAIIAAIC
jgi:hypothetical protein